MARISVVAVRSDSSSRFFFLFGSLRWKGNEDQKKHHLSLLSLSPLSTTPHLGGQVEDGADVDLVWLALHHRRLHVTRVLEAVVPNVNVI